MIIINIQFLMLIGMRMTEADELAKAPVSIADGLAVSYLFSFGGGGDPRALDAIRASGSVGKSVLLVGMADRYDYAKTLELAELRAICARSFAAQLPTADEADELCAALATCPHRAAARISGLVRIADLSTSST